ncbi:ion channel [Methanobrevibacter sp.]
MSEYTKSKDVMYFIMNILILADIILIFNLLFFNHAHQGLIWAFDVFVCFIVLLDYFIKLYHSKNRMRFLKKHWMLLIASIPLEFISPIFILLRILLVTELFMIFRASDSFSGCFNGVTRFLENTKLDEILNWIMFTVILFTFALYFLDSSMNLFDSLWFVVVTLTTVGYGDVTPDTPVGKVISLFLLILGIFVFSTMVGAISSYFTDKVLDIDSDTEEALDILNEKVDRLEVELADIKGQLEQADLENQKLHEKIDELLKK